MAAVSAPVRLPVALPSVRPWWAVAAVLVVLQGWLLVDAFGAQDALPATDGAEAEAGAGAGNRTAPLGRLGSVPRPEAWLATGAAAEAGAGAGDPDAALVVVEVPQEGATVTIDGAPFAIHSGYVRYESRVGHRVTVHVSAPGFVPRQHVIVIGEPIEIVAAGLEPDPIAARPEDAAMQAALQALDASIALFEKMLVEIEAAPDVQTAAEVATRYESALTEQHRIYEENLAQVPDAAHQQLEALKNEKLRPLLPRLIAALSAKTPAGEPELALEPEPEPEVVEPETTVEIRRGCGLVEPEAYFEREFEGERANILPERDPATYGPQ